MLNIKKNLLHVLTSERSPRFLGGMWGLLGHQKPSSLAMLESSPYPLRDGVACAPRFMPVWLRQLFFPLLLYLNLDFRNLKILEHSFNLLILQIWFLFFLIQFLLSWIIYKILKKFNFISFQSFHLLNLVSIFFFGKVF